MSHGVIYLALLFQILCTPGGTWRRERMIGGRPVTDYKYPWVVSIASVYKPRSGENGTRNQTWLTYGCTGSIIDVYGTVITAAHCLDRTQKIRSGNVTRRYKLDNVKVKWGSYIGDMSHGRVETIRNVSMMTRRHPDSYSVHRNRNITDIDVGLIYLSTLQKNPIKCRNSSTVLPIKLSDERRRFHKPSNGTVAGFGCQANINKSGAIIGYIMYLDANLSEHSVRYAGRADDLWGRRITYNTSANTSAIFYGHANFNENAPLTWATRMRYSGTCMGDSGGPYMEKEWGKIRLRGVIKGTHGHKSNDICCRAFKPILLMDLNYYSARRWILDEIRAMYSRTEGIGNLSTVPRPCVTI